MNWKKRAARAVLVAALAASGIARADMPVSDLARDFLASPAANPIPAGDDAEWLLLRSEGSSGALTPLAAWRSDFGTIPGLVGWTGDESCNYHGCFPVVAVNTTGAAVVFPWTGETLVVPADAVFIHPADGIGTPNGNAAVAWRSAANAWVNVDVEVARLHPGSITWQVDLDGVVLRGPERLEAGTGAYAARQLQVRKGQLVTVRIDADGSYGADSSQLSFRVERVPGP